MTGPRVITGASRCSTYLPHASHSPGAPARRYVSATRHAPEEKVLFDERPLGPDVLAYADYVVDAMREHLIRHRLRRARSWLAADAVTIRVETVVVRADDVDRRLAHRNHVRAVEIVDER